LLSILPCQQIQVHSYLLSHGSTCHKTLFFLNTRYCKTKSRVQLKHIFVALIFYCVLLQPGLNPQSCQHVPVTARSQPTELSTHPRVVCMGYPIAAVVSL
jgi:hypothetical protein